MRVGLGLNWPNLLLNPFNIGSSSSSISHFYYQIQTEPIRLLTGWVVLGSQVVYKMKNNFLLQKK
jgi:hypothetical protein